MLILNYDASELLTWDGDSPTTTVIADTGLGVNGPWDANSITIGSGAGPIYIGNYDAGDVLKLDDTVSIPTIFADTTDGLVHPVAIQVLANGHLVVGNDGSGGDILQFDPTTGTGSLFDNIGAGAEVVSMAVRPNGDLYVLSDQGRIFRYIGGDPSMRVVLGVYPGGQGGIDFNVAGQVIYHIHQATGELRTIHSVTGNDTVEVVLAGKRPMCIAVTGSHLAHGTFAPLEAGVPGTGGITPQVFSFDEPRVGDPAVLRFREFVGGSLIYFFLGLGGAELTVYGGNFHVDVSGQTFWTVKLVPAGGAAGVAGDGNVDVPFVMPTDPIFIGSFWYMQALAPDAGAPFGVSMSNFMKMYVGDQTP